MRFSEGYAAYKSPGPLKFHFFVFSLFTPASEFRPLLFSSAHTPHADGGGGGGGVVGP